jgi:enoyl-[acyl-carrier protein] reductase I
MGFLSGKKLLITGVLSNRSIAYGIAKACHAQGAELAFSYVGERFKDRITEFAADFGSKLIFDCDVGDDAQIEKLFQDLSATWPKFDGFVHSIGFAPREAIAGDFLEGLSREGFKIAHDISAYSFPAMAKAALPYLNDKSALLTLTYLGSMPHGSQLQHHGAGQGRSKPRCATWRSRWARRASASTASAPARSRRWPPAASRASARS